MYLQYNLNGSNPDGSFTMDDSNSFFQFLQKNKKQPIMHKTPSY